jgi:hypothetical protein
MRNKLTNSERAELSEIKEVQRQQQRLKGAAENAARVLSAVGEAARKEEVACTGVNARDQHPAEGIATAKKMQWLRSDRDLV